ncbi:hypothetical protein SNEBB_008885 [Seison nebaliae]|nr:hypothetical protein SNEBB_008885 [Seison nebaliae]
MKLKTISIIFILLISNIHQSISSEFGDEQKNNLTILHLFPSYIEQFIKSLAKEQTDDKMRIEDAEQICLVPKKFFEEYVKIYASTNSTDDRLNKTHNIVKELLETNSILYNSSEIYRLSLELESGRKEIILRLFDQYKKDKISMKKKLQEYLAYAVVGMIIVLVVR